jgi:hypothetical protein
LVFPWYCLGTELKRLVWYGNDPIEKEPTAGASVPEVRRMRDVSRGAQDNDDSNPPSHADENTKAVLVNVICLLRQEIGPDVARIGYEFDFGAMAIRSR